MTGMAKCGSNSAPIASMMVSVRMTNAQKVMKWRGARDAPLEQPALAEHLDDLDLQAVREVLQAARGGLPAADQPEQEQRTSRCDPEGYGHDPEPEHEPENLVGVHATSWLHACEHARAYAGGAGALRVPSECDATGR